MKAIKAIYEKGRIKLSEKPAEQGPMEVLVVFPEPADDPWDRILNDPAPRPELSKCVNEVKNELAKMNESPASEEALVASEGELVVPLASNLPDDFATNHDYYLHGGRKQKPRIGRWIRPVRPTSELTEQEAAEFTDKLLELAVDTRNLPADLASNHDHYVHGLPKR